MYKATCMEVCILLSPTCKHSNTKTRPTLSVEKLVAIALWKLEMPDNYWSAGNEFGVEKSTMEAAVIQVAKVINTLLLQNIVTLGNMQGIVGWLCHNEDP